MFGYLKYNKEEYVIVINEERIKKKIRDKVKRKWGIICWGVIVESGWNGVLL